jgi:hypothetical protein
MHLPMAIQAFPKHKESLREAASTGRLDRTESGGGEVQWNKEGGIYQNRQMGTVEEEVNFKRKMVTIRTQWIRNTDYGKMDTLEAEEKGLVESRKDGQWLLTRTQELITEDSVDWPRDVGIRQLTTLPQIDRVVGDIRCPFKDIPAPWSKSGIIPNSPHGKGEPDRLCDLQTFINRQFSHIDNNAAYNSYPEEIMPLSLRDQLDDAGALDEMHSHPGRQMFVDDTTFEEYVMPVLGKGGFHVTPPQLPSGVVQTLQIALQLWDRISGTADALEGRQPSSRTSGKAIDALQQAARGPIAMKGRSTEYVLRWLGTLLIDAIARWLPNTEWKKYLSKYPDVIRADIKERIGKLEYDVSPTIDFNRAASNAQDAQNAEDAMRLGKLTDETYLEKKGIPNAKEEAKKRQAQDRKAQAAAGQPPAPPAT